MLNLFQKVLPIVNINLKTTYTIPNTLKKFIHRRKDQLDHFAKQSVIYKIECVDCEASYIGQTKRRL